MSHDGGKRRCDDRGWAILIYAQVIALGATLLDHDGDEAGFREDLIGQLARTQDLSGIAVLADDLGRRLAATRARPAIGGRGVI